MSHLYFYTTGPLPVNSPSYIRRKADEQVFLHLSRMEYISIIEPRQHGKTSLIIQLMNAFKPSGYTFVLCDLRDMPSANRNNISAKEWYSLLGQWILPQLIDIIPTVQRPSLPESSTLWRDFLFALAERAKTVDQRIVIILDDAARVPPSLATDFFAAIRSVFTSRHSFPYLEYLTFIIAGAFNPKELIQDSAISGFNIDQRIHLEDFDLAQVRQLVTLLNLPDNITEALAKRVYYWTNGQPFLSQELCHSLAEQKKIPRSSSINSLVDDTVTRFLSHNSHYMDRFKRLSEDTELLKYAKSIAAGDRPRLIAGVDNRHFRLAHVLGIIKADAYGLCQIRNRICQKALAEVGVPSDAIRPGSTQPLNLPPTFEERGLTPPLEEVSHDVFISYSHEDKENVQSKLLSRLEGEGLRLYIDEQHFEVGAPILTNITNAISKCRKILLALTPNSVNSEWVRFEILHTQTNDPTNQNLRLIPVILKPCTLPKELQHVTCLDLTEPAEFEKRMQRLILSLKP